MPARLRVTTGVLVVLLVVGAGVRLAVDADPAGMDPRTLVPPLLGFAGLCVVGLAARRSPSIAWLACVFVALMAAATLAPVGAGIREGRAMLGGPFGWAGAGEGLTEGSAAPGPVALTAAALVRAALLAPAAVAAAYASEGRRVAAPWVPAIAWGIVVILGLVGGVGFAQLAMGARPADVAGIPAVAWLGGITCIVILGAWGDVAPAARRVRARTAGDVAPRGPVEWLRLLAEELLPWREAARVEAAESERGRLASDLHAEVLPGLRAALAAAESGGSPERLAAQLRGTVADVEGLLEARRSVVVEELGLVAGLEWLAERVEERSSVRVELEVEGAASSDGRPPRAVERAAFRIAQLALDNVARHAPEATVVVSVVAEASRVAVVLRDDGPGMDRAPVRSAPADRGYARQGGRGLADMYAEAKACGGELWIRAGTDGRGVAVGFAWPAPMRDGT